MDVEIEDNENTGFTTENDLPLELEIIAESDVLPDLELDTETSNLCSISTDLLALYELAKL